MLLGWEDGCDEGSVDGSLDGCEDGWLDGWNEMDEITLAYAISIHKSQGSEFSTVIVVLLSQHYLMLQRNLLYTAVTRAKNLCVMVSNNKAIGMSVRNNNIKNRNSRLAERITEGLKT